MVDGSETGVLGEIENVPITVEGISNDLTFLMVKEVPFSLIIKRLAMKTKRQFILIRTSPLLGHGQK